MECMLHIKNYLHNLDSNDGAIVSIEIRAMQNLTPKRYETRIYSIYPIYYYVLENIKNLEGDQFIRLTKRRVSKFKKNCSWIWFCFGKNSTTILHRKLKELFHGEVVVMNEIK